MWRLNKNAKNEVYFIEMKKQINETSYEKYNNEIEIKKWDITMKSKQTIKDVNTITTNNNEKYVWKWWSAGGALLIENQFSLSNTAAITEIENLYLYLQVKNYKNE